MGARWGTPVTAGGGPLGGLGDAWAFWGLSLSSILACISAVILGRGKSHLMSTCCVPSLTSLSLQ